MSHYGVDIHTWGTSPYGGSGLLHALDANLFGGNVGHAAMCITFADDEQGKTLHQLCEKNNIPCQQVDLITSVDNKGNPITTPAYQAYWSFFPAEGEPFFLQNNITEDSIDERKGAHVEASGYIKQEKRKVGGFVGSRTIRLGPEYIFHERNSKEQPGDTIEDIQKNVSKVQAMLLIEKNTKLLCDEKTKELFERVKQKKENLGETEKNFLHNMNMFYENNSNIEELIHKKEEELSAPALLAKAHILERLLNNVLTFSDVEYALTKIQELDETERRDFLSNIETRIERVGNTVVLKEKFKETIKNLILKTTENKHVYSTFNKDKISSTLKEPTLQKKISVVEELIKDPLLKKHYPDEEHQIQYALRKINKRKDKETRKKFKAAIKNLAEKINDHSIKERVDLLFASQEEENKLHGMKNSIDYFSEGSPPSATISLPFSDVKENNLDLSEMIEKMVEIKKKDIEFNLFSNNCSNTVGSILRAGAKKDFKLFFEGKALNLFANPQQIFNSALDYQKYLNKGKIGRFLQKIKYRNAIEKTTASLVETMIHDPLTQLKYSKDAAGKKPTYSARQKIMAGINLSLLSPLLLSYFILKSTLIDPLGVFRACRDTLQFAFSKKPILLKTISLVVLPFMALSALPATLQYSIGRTISKIKAFNDARHAKKDPSFEYSKMEKKGLHDLSEHVKNTVIEIKDKSPEKALQSFEETLIEKKQVPSFEKKTHTRVLQWLRRHPDQKNHYTYLFEEAHKKAFTTSKAPTHPKKSP